MSCEDNPECKYYPACYTDAHHIFYPEKNYKTRLEKLFRGLHVVEICRATHEEIHATETPPNKPSREEMLHKINNMIYISPTDKHVE